MSQDKHESYLRAMANRRVLFVTGTRADYGKLKSIMRAVDESDDHHCVIFATGMHLLSSYGRTWIEIEKDGFSELFLHFNQDRHTDVMPDRVLAETIRGLSLFVAESSIDMIVVHGDRLEALAGAIVGALNGILVSHIEGGELSGTIDELMRHTITKLAHLHFVSNSDARNRVLRMGEYPEKVFVIGSPNIDIMLSADLPPIEEVLNHYEFPGPDYGLMVFHPSAEEVAGIHDRTSALLSALAATSRNFVVLFPNNDPGSNLVLKAMNEFEGTSTFRFLPSMRFEHYLTALSNAAVLVGNSSSGMHEAPVYGVPVVNIGNRQLNRFTHRCISNIEFDADPDTIADLVIEKWGQRYEPTGYFGSGGSAERFLAVLRDPETWATNPMKQFLDQDNRSN